MKITILLLLLFTSSLVSVNEPDLVKVRSPYEKSTRNIKYCEKLIKILQPYNELNNPLLFLGYKASATILMTNYVFNPLNKINYFNKGVEMLEKARNADGLNVELRFLSYVIQSSAPSYLGYNKILATDSAFLIENLKSLTDIHLHKHIAAFLKHTE